MKTFAPVVPNHRNLSVKTRCRLVIRLIYSGSTSKQLEEEFGRKIATLMHACKEQHYSNSPKGQQAYETLKQKLRENDKSARTTETAESPITTSAMQTMQPPEQPVTTSCAEEKPVYLVETGTFLHMELDQLFQLASGDTIIYVPRFCIDELAKMSRDDDRAKSAIMKMYTPEIFQKKVIPLSNVQEEQCLLSGSNYPAYKRRSIGIVNTALNLALTGSKKVRVLTTSREVTDLLREIISRERLHELLSFTYVAHPRKDSQPSQPVAKG